MAKKSKKKTRSRTAKKKGPRANRKRPYIQAALICERILSDAHDVMSFIRVIDMLEVTGPAPQMPPGLIRFDVYVAFKAGEAVGDRELRVTANDPSGSAMPGECINTLHFTGGEQGAGVRIAMHLGIRQTGVYWIDVVLSGELMTRIPLRVRYKRTRVE